MPAPMQLLAFGVPRPVLRSPCWAGVEHAAIGRCCTGASNVTTARATSPVSEGCWASGRSREACCVYEEPCAGVGAGSAEMWEDIKTLESEIAEIDAGQAEATAVRQKEHEEYVKASTDFKECASAGIELGLRFPQVKL